MKSMSEATTGYTSIIRSVLVLDQMFKLLFKVSSSASDAEIPKCNNHRVIERQTSSFLLQKKKKNRKKKNQEKRKKVKKRLKKI